MRITSTNLVRDYRFLITSSKIDVYELNYRWYAQARYYQAHADQLDFLNYVTKKLIAGQTEAPQKDLRTRQSSIRRGESDCALTIFSLDIIWKVTFKTESK